MINNKKEKKLNYYGWDNHIMNKNESKEFRKIKSETGLSFEDIIKVKKYRKRLSEAQKKDQYIKTHFYKKVIFKIRKNITKKLKLPKEHPDVIREVNNFIKENRYTYYKMHTIPRNYRYKGEI